MGRPEMAEKHKNPATQVCGRHPPSSARSGHGREILPAAASRRPPPPWPTRVQGGWPESPPTVET